jgi:RNA polymerase sigma factor (sigma-70 family)
MTASVDLGQDIRTLAPGLIARRRAIHEHPELAFEEVWTAATLAARLRTPGLAVEEGIGGTGVLAVLEGRTPGRTLLVRADMDALAMEETTGRACASDNARRARLLGRVAEVAGALMGAAGGTLRADVDDAIPAVVNEAHVTRAVERAAQRVIGQANIITGWRNRFADDVGLFLAEVADWSESPEEELLSKEGRAAPRRMIASLPDHYRLVLLLRDMEELSNEETAEILGDTVASVKSRLHRARMALREPVTRSLVFGLVPDGRTAALLA